MAVNKQLDVNADHLRLIPVEYEDEFRRDARIAWQSYGDVGIHSDYPYFENMATIHAAVKSRKNPFDDSTYSFDPGFKCEDNFLRFMHIDLGLTGDACGISMVHIPKWVLVNVVSRDEKTKTKKVDRVLRPYFYFDFIGRIEAPKGGEIIFSQVREIIYQLSDLGFPIQLITYDRFQSVDSIQILRQHGYIVAHLSLDSCKNYPVVDISKEERFEKVSTAGGKYATLAPWQTYKSALNQYRVDLPFYKPLTQYELDKAGISMYRGVDDFGNKGGSQTITWIEQETMQATYNDKKLKVEERPKGTIDLLESCAGSVFDCSNNVDWEPTETDLDRKKRKFDEKLHSQETIFDQEYVENLAVEDTSESGEFDDSSVFE